MTYDRVNWENEPSENTPLSAENLNKMDSAIKQLSEMVVANPVEADTDELKKITIEGTVYKIAGGHELVNASGSTMTQRSKMSFPDSHLTDDSGNNQTIVDIVKEVTTAQWNNATEEGLYYINDKPDSIITAEQVAYGNSNVETALDKRIEHITTTSTPASQIKMTHSTVDITITVGSQFNNVVNVSDITNGECDNANYILGVMAHTIGTTDIYVIGSRVSGTNQLVLRLGSAGGATALDISSNNLPTGTYKFALTVIYIPHSS